MADTQNITTQIERMAYQGDVAGLLAVVEGREKALREALGAVVAIYRPMRQHGADGKADTYHCRACLAHWEQGQGQDHYERCIYDIARRALGEG